MRWILIFILCGCATVDPLLDPAIYYKRDVQMEFRDNGKGTGTLVVPQRGRYRIKFRFAGKTDLLLLKTCHREIKLEDTGHREKLYFYPIAGIEDTGFCFLEVSAFEAKRGRHSWGLVDFWDPNGPFNIKAKVKCNGQSYDSPGVTVCQAKEGLIQRIEFSQHVIGSSVGKCGNIAPEFTKVIEFKMPNRECTFILRGADKNFHKLTTIGYEKVLVREL